MPWCEDCAKFWNPNSLPPDGSCPTCGRVIAEPPDQKAPWHFWIFVVGVVMYLGWRLVQLVQWLVGEGHGVVAALVGAASAALVAWAARWLFRREPEPTDGADEPAAE